MPARSLLPSPRRNPLGGFFPTGMARWESIISPRGKLLHAMGVGWTCRAYGVACKAQMSELLDRFQAGPQGKRESVTQTQTNTHAKIKRDDEVQASYPEVLDHFNLEDKDPEVNDAVLQKYVKMKYCRKVLLPKKDRGVAAELSMHEGLIK
jgi:hypothetical protein